MRWSLASMFCRCIRLLAVAGWATGRVSGHHLNIIIVFVIVTSFHVHLMVKTCVGRVDIWFDIIILVDPWVWRACGTGRWRPEYRLFRLYLLVLLNILILLLLQQTGKISVIWVGQQTWFHLKVSWVGSSLIANFPVVRWGHWMVSTYFMCIFYQLFWWYWMRICLLNQWQLLLGLKDSCCLENNLVKI